MEMADALVALALRPLKLFKDERLPDCLEEGMRGGFEAERNPDGDSVIEVVELRVEVSARAGIGDEAAGLTMDIRVDASGFEFPSHMEMAVARSDRAMATVTLSAVGDDSVTLDSGELLELLIEEARG